MKTVKLLSGIFLILFCTSWKTNTPPCKNSIYILSQVQKKYDAQQHWADTDMKIHIQEPRVGNPQRHTKLTLKNSTDYFEIERFREDGIVKRILTGTGESQIFLNGEAELSEEIIEKYRLYADRSKGHKNFYKLMYGLPMTIDKTLWEKILPAEKSSFQGQEVYRVSMELNEAMISKYWTLLIGIDNFELLAIEFNHPDEPEKEEELMTFEGKFEVNGIQIPRIRNWYIKGTQEYLGTDVIVEELK